MADLAQIERALRNADAAGDTAAATRLAAAYRAAQPQQNAPAAPAPNALDGGMAADAAAGGEPVTPGQQHASRTALGFEQGVGNFLGNMADMAGQVPGVSEGFQSVTGHALADSTKALRNPAHAPGVKPNTAGRVAADMLETAPIAAVFPQTMLGNVAGGAVTTGLTSNEGDQGDGAAIGGAIGGATHGLSRVIAPIVAPAVERLRNAGVTLTPGQIWGGMTKGVEDRLAGLPIVGDVIKHAQRNSMREAVNGRINQALEPLAAVGGPVPVGPGIIPYGTPLPTIPHPETALPDGVTGQDSVRFAGDELSHAYNSVVPHTSTVLDPNFWAGVQTRVNQAAARVLPGHEQQLRSTVADVFSKLGPVSPTTQISGETMKTLDSEFGDLGRRFAGTNDNVNNGPLSQVFNGIRSDLRGAVATSNPTLAHQIRAIDQGYASLVPVEDAAGNATGNAAGLEPGIFTGRQLRQSTERYSDQSVRHRAMGRGTAPGQQYAEDMVQVLPSSVPDSGSAGRWLLPAIATGAAPFSAPAAISAAAIPAIYSRPALTAINTAFARNAGPGATAIADVFRNLGRMPVANAGGK